MAEKVSETDPALITLDAMEDFRKHAQQSVMNGRRKLYILSETLDNPVFNTEAFRDAVRDMVIQDRYCEARILVKDIKPVVERGHRLLELSRRLSSKVEIRKLTVPPQDSEQGYLIVDRETLLYKHNDSTYNGFIDTNAGPRCKVLIEEFNNLWELYGEKHLSLKEQLI